MPLLRVLHACVARAALQVTGGQAAVVGLDTSQNMLTQIQRALQIPLIRANA